MYLIKQSFINIISKILTFCLLFLSFTYQLLAEEGNKINDIENNNKEAFIAIVNDEEILLHDLLIAKEDIENQILQNNPNILTSNNLIEMLIIRKFIAQQAKKQELDKSSEYQKRLKYYQEKALYDVYYNNLKDNIANLSDARNRYDELKVKAEKILQKRVMRIVFPDEATAHKAIKEHNMGVSFEELIKKYTSENNKKFNGDLGYFSKSDVQPQFAELIFSLNVGDISIKPIKADDGYHIIKITDEREKPFPKFEDVKEVLLNDLKYKKAKKHMDELREKSQIIYHSSLVVEEGPNEVDTKEVDTKEEDDIKED